MSDTSAMDFSLKVSPDQSQFFRGDKVTLSCGDTGAWTVKRNTSSEYKQKCSDWGGEQDGSSCSMRLFPSDSGQYWCEENSSSTDPVNITVQDRGVVLQAPVLPVSLGQTVSLICRNHTSPALPARFYRDGQSLSEWPAGNMTLQQVALSDEGLYECEIRGERSAPSPLRVRADENLLKSSTPPSVQTSAQAPVPPLVSSSLPLGLILGSVLVLLVLLMLLVLVVFMAKRCQKQTEDDACLKEGGADDITYSDILHHPKRRPIRCTEKKKKEESPVYSSVKTDDVCYSSVTINQSRGKGLERPKNRVREESPVYASVKTDDVCYSSVAINQSRDPVQRAKERRQNQTDSSTYAQIKVRTK